MAVPFTHFAIFCLLAMWCTKLARTETAQACVSDYPDFEEATIANNPGNVHALFSVLYSPNQPLPFSMVILYQVLLPNGTTQRISSDPGCSNELWMWTYSPVFLLLEPSLLNKLTLYTLNIFRDWKSPTVTLTVPLPCENVSYSFLSEMTMAANSYALGEVEHKRRLGFVLYGCGKTAEQSHMYPSLSSDHYELGSYIFALKYIAAFSSLFQIMFTFLATSMLLSRWLPQVALTSPNLPTEDYSKFWAICTAASMIMAMTSSTVLYSAIITIHYHPLHAGSDIALILVAAIIEFPVALYFAKTYTIAVPGVYLVPAKVICCGKEKISTILVRTVFLLMPLTAVQFALFHCMVLVLVFVAAPFNIGSSIAMLLFVVFATVHILAILFTLPSLCRQTVGTMNRREKCQAIIQGVSLVILLITIFCFSIVLANFGHLINIGTDQESFLPALSKVILPLALGLTTYLLKRLSNMWWETLARRTQSASPNDSVDEPMIEIQS